MEVGDEVGVGESASPVPCLSLCCALIVIVAGAIVGALFPPHDVRDMSNAARRNKNKIRGFMICFVIVSMDFLKQILLRNAGKSLRHLPKHSDSQSSSDHLSCASDRQPCIDHTPNRRLFLP